MTTVAYKDGIIAADRLVTDRNLRCGLVDKLYTCPDGSVLGVAGALSSVMPFVDWIRGGSTESERPNLQDDEFEAIRVFPGRKVWWYGHNCRPVTMEISPEGMAIGSGFKVAMAVMHVGGSAIAAVQCAIDLDVSTGGGPDWLGVEAI